MLVMAKTPRPGSVKTRLGPLLGPEGCARLAAALLRHTLALAREVAAGRTYLAFDPPGSDPELDGLVCADVEIFAQEGTDLGRRLEVATTRVLGAHHGPVIALGTDAPTLTAEILQEGADSLRSGADVVFGPALDGGYYAVGLARPLPPVFDLDRSLWGGPDVLAASLAGARSAGARVGMLPSLRDLDTPLDALALLEDPRLPAEIADCLAGRP